MQLREGSSLFKRVLSVVYESIGEAKERYKGLVESNAFDSVVMSCVPEAIARKVESLVASSDFKDEFIKDEVNVNPVNSEYRLKLYREVLEKVLDKSPYQFRDLLNKADLDLESLKDLYYSFDMSYDND